jgi:hypothetical protein
MYCNHTLNQSFRQAWSRSKGRTWWGVVLASLGLLCACSAPTSSRASRPPGRELSTVGRFVLSIGRNARTAKSAYASPRNRQNAPGRQGGGLDDRVAGARQPGQGSAAAARALRNPEGAALACAVSAAWLLRHPIWRACALGMYRLLRDAGFAVGALLSGLVADAYGIPAAILVVAGLTAASGTIVAIRMYETNGVRP